MPSRIRLLWLLLFAGLFAPTLFSVQTAAAQTTIDVQTNEAFNSFPLFVFFGLEAESEIEIEQIWLIYGTNALSCQDSGSRQRIDFETSSTIEVSWVWELGRSGALPPGSEVWWEWELIDSDGNSTILDRQMYATTDDRYEWRSLSRDGVTVYWYQGSQSFGNSILDLATEGLARLSEEAGIEPLANIQVWVYPTAAQVREALIVTVEWAGGVAFSEYGNTIVGIAPGETTWAAQVIPHEITHLVVGVLTFNCRGVDLPTWLSEGIARYAEGDALPSKLQDLTDALSNDRLPPLRSLANGFSAFSGEASLSYTQSGEVVRFMVEAYGPEKLNQLFLTMRDGQPIDEALMTVYGLNTDGLDVAFRESYGYSATPTSEADAAALAATPTQIATISLGGIPVAQTDTPTPTNTPLPTATATLLPTASATATIIPTVEPSPSADAVAANEIDTEATATVQPAGALQTTSTNSPWIIWTGFGVLAVAALIILGIGLRRQNNGSQ